MTTRYFKVLHKAGAFIDGVHYPCADDQADVSESIVPLELKKGEKAPLWGVEVDVNGNEIGERPREDGVSDKLAEGLANSIAGKAGAGTKATGDKKDQEQRKQTIVDTLQLLDHGKDDDWTAGGLPKVEVVASASGLEGLTRDEITQADPDFKREVKEAE